MGSSKRASSTERALIGVFEEALAAPGARRVAARGIGDDAAVLRPQRGSLVWSIDTSIEAVHFDLSWLTLGQAAARAYVAAVSDLAAMGAKPVAALCSVHAPQGAARSRFSAVARAQAHVSQEYGCPIVGGNLAQDSHWVFTTTVMGSTQGRGVARGGARVGDEVWLVGDVGMAAAGLRLLQSRRAARSRAQRACVTAWRSPKALISAGRRLAKRATAMIDVSDGLASEADHIADASGVRLEISAARLAQQCSPELASVARQLGEDPAKLMLEGGEDYALLATGPTAARPRDVRVIGRVVDGHGAWLVEADTQCRLGVGFDHFGAGGN